MSQLGILALLSKSGQIPHAPATFFFLPHFVLALSSSCGFNSITVSLSSS